MVTARPKRAIRSATPSCATGRWPARWHRCLCRSLRTHPGPDRSQAAAWLRLCAEQGLMASPTPALPLLLVFLTEPVRNGLGLVHV